RRDGTGVADRATVVAADAPARAVLDAGFLLAVHHVHLEDVGGTHERAVAAAVARVEVDADAAKDALGGIVPLGEVPAFLRGERRHGDLSTARPWSRPRTRRSRACPAR